MKNNVQPTQINQNYEYRKRYYAEMQRKFIDLQFKRSELEKKLKRVNEVLFNLGREMDEQFSYDQLYK
tara:strand:- start:257 stop:460 length:204 start_codon:yes stop_codon:yes gene_type:complete